MANDVTKARSARVNEAVPPLGGQGASFDKRFDRNIQLFGKDFYGR